VGKLSVLTIATGGSTLSATGFSLATTSLASSSPYIAACQMDPQCRGSSFTCFYCAHHHHPFCAISLYSICFLLSINTDQTFLCRGVFGPYRMEIPTIQPCPVLHHNSGLVHPRWMTVYLYPSVNNVVPRVAHKYWIERTTKTSGNAFRNRYVCLCCVLLNFSLNLYLGCFLLFVCDNICGWPFFTFLLSVICLRNFVINTQHTPRP